MRNPFLDYNIMRFQRRDLVRIVRHQADTVETEAVQHHRSRCIDPLIRVEAKLLVCVYRIEAVILQLVGAKLVDETDPAAFLRQIQQNAAAIRRDFSNCAAQLISTVATQAGKQIPGKAFRMQPCEDR